MFILDEILENWMIAKPYSISEVDVTICVDRQPNAWIINENYILKKFTNPDYMKRGIDITKALADEGIPVAVPVETKVQTDFYAVNNEYYCLYPKLKGKGLKDHFQGDCLNRAKYLGQIIGELHRAFVKCEGVVSIHENNLFKDVVNWAIPTSMEFAGETGIAICDELIRNYQSEFKEIYKQLPRHLIHRDMHGENLLFENEKLTGYIDFDLGQRNVRIFDPCYMATGILSTCFDNAGKREQWISIFKSIINGYDSVCALSREEKRALIFVLYSIEFIFIAFFARDGYPQLAEININMLNWIFESRSKLEVL